MNSRKLSWSVGPAPLMEAFQQAPPSFDFAEQHQQYAAPAAAPALPSFDFLEQQQVQESAPPTAPPAMAMYADHLQGIMPVAPPMAPLPQYNPQ